VQTAAKILVNFALVTIMVVLPVGAIAQGYRRQGWLKASLKLVLPLILAIPLGLWLEAQDFLTVVDTVLLVMIVVVIIGFVTKLDSD
jgi:hypothetical protein